MYYANKLLWMMGNPHLLGLVGIVVGLSLRHTRFVRLSKWLLFLSVLWAYIWSSGFMFNDWGRDMMRDYPPRVICEYPNADAVVDLGGGIGHGDTLRDGLEMICRKGDSEIDIEEHGGEKKIGWVEISSSGDRAWFAAELWKAGKAPIVIPSGRGCDKTDKVFLSALGVSTNAIVVENFARNTEENAKFVRDIMVKRVVDRRPKVLVVTSHWHMRRSMLMFEKYAPQLDVVPAPIDFEGRGYAEVFWRKLIPTLEHYNCNCLNFHEWLGYWGYKLFR